jgi:hypothetical protein
MALFKITTKQSGTFNGIRLEKGMTVEVITAQTTSPIGFNGSKLVYEAFLRKYGVDLKKAMVLNTAYLHTEKIN